MEIGECKDFSRDIKVLIVGKPHKVFTGNMQSAYYVLQRLKKAGYNVIMDNFKGSYFVETYKNPTLLRKLAAQYGSEWRPDKPVPKHFNKSKSKRKKR